MKEFMLCDRILAFDLVKHVLTLHIATYSFVDHQVVCSAKHVKSVKYDPTKTVMELVQSISVLVNDATIKFSDDVMKGFAELFKATPDLSNYTPKEPDVVITSYTLDSQSFEFTTNHGIFRVTETEDLTNAYCQLIGVLRNNDIHCDWITFPRD